MKNERLKKILPIAISLALGFGAGFAVKDITENNSANASEPAKVAIEKISGTEVAKSNKLIGPKLWDIYLDPLWVPVEFSVKPLPLAPLVSFPTDVPKVQTINDTKELRVIVQVPGMSEKDVKVQASEDTVTVKGHKAQEKKDGSLFESVSESFEQTVHLPSKVNPDKVQATVKDGVLTVVLPKDEKTKASTK